MRSHTLHLTVFLKGIVFVKPFALMIARQRSGTGALGSILDQHPSLHYLGEIFHPNNIDQNDNYFNFHLNRIADDPSNALPDSNERNFEAFVDYITHSSGGKLPVFDIKYRSFHHLNGGWQGLQAAPWVIAFAINQGAPIIHLKRANFVSSYISGRLAEENQVWHAQSAVEVQSTSVDIGRLISYLETTTAEVALVDKWLNGIETAIDVEYADLFGDDGLLTPFVAESLASCLRVSPLISRTPAFLKQAPNDQKKAIENFSVVQMALTGTEYSWMLQS